MDNNDKNQEFDLEEIMREFGGEVPEEPAGEAQELPQEETGAPEEPVESQTAVEEELPEEAEQVPQGDTVRLDTLPIPGNEEAEEPEETQPEAPDGQTRVLPEISEIYAEEETDAEEESCEEPEAEEYVLTAEQIPAPKPIPFRSRLSELKRKLVAGPEKRYYDLSEIGLGRLQMSIFLNLVVVALCAAAAYMYAMDMVPENRMRLMLFSQILAMMVSALLGCYVLMDGIADLFTGKFSLNTMLFLTLAACSADAVFCLRELRVPCCAAFSLEMTFALWNRSLRRSTEMGQMDTLRKANRLDGIVKLPDHKGEGPVIVRTEGRVEDFMDHYTGRTGPEKALNLFALLSVLACIGIAVLAGVVHDLSLGIQVFAAGMLVAVPAGAFVSQSRPTAILERRMHMVGTVLCGWKGIKSLCGKAFFPLYDRDIFPVGAVKLNGVKFLGSRAPEDVIAGAAALMCARGGGLEPVFTQLLESHGGKAYEVYDLRVLTEGLMGEINGETCLLGLSECLKEQGVEIPESALVSNALYYAVDGILTAVFALNYSRTKASAAGLVTLGGNRKLRPMILCRNFMINRQLLKEKFGIRAKRFDFPDPEVRDEFADFEPDPELIAGALTTQQNLSSMAYAVTGARALRRSCRVGVVLHMVAGIVGLLIMAALAYLGDLQLLSPLNILLYQLVWMIPGLLVTEWARTV